MQYGWRAFFIALHLTSFVFMAGIISGYNFVNQDLVTDIQNTGKLDAIAVAYQIGRLDIASLVLTFIGILIALGAIFGIIQVRIAAEEKAVMAAGPAAEKVARKIAIEIAESEAAPEARRIAVEALENLNIDWAKIATEYPRSEESDSGDAFAQALNSKDEADD